MCPLAAHVFHFTLITASLYFLLPLPSKVGPSYRFLGQTLCNGQDRLSKLSVTRDYLIHVIGYLESRSV